MEYTKLGRDQGKHKIMLETGETLEVSDEELQRIEDAESVDLDQVVTHDLSGAYIATTGASHVLKPMVAVETPEITPEAPEADSEPEEPVSEPKPQKEKTKK